MHPYSTSFAQREEDNVALAVPMPKPARAIARLAVLAKNPMNNPNNKNTLSCILRDSVLLLFTDKKAINENTNVRTSNDKRKASK